MTYGLTQAQYDAVIAEMLPILVATAKRSALISYSELVGKLRSVRLEPDSSTLAGLLCDISTAEANAGRGMLSAVVVHKTGDKLPGAGFYVAAAALGRDTSDKLRCAVAELNAVYAAWRRSR